MNDINNRYILKMKFNLNKLNYEIMNIKQKTNIIKKETCNFNVCNNINYISSIINNIKNEFSKIIIKKNNNDNNVNENINQLSFLFNHINKVIKFYDIEKDNYELINIKFKKENIEHFIPKKERIIERFDFSFITDALNSLLKPIQDIGNMFVDFGKWLGGAFLDMIKLFIKVLEFLLKFFIVILPKLLKQLYLFLVKFAIKFIKVGIITILFGTALFIILNNYWKYVLNENTEEDIPMTLTLLPTIVITWSIFWKKTYIFEYAQIKIIKTFMQLLRGSLKLIFIYMLGLPEDHKFFTTNSKDFLELSEYFFDMLYKNLDTIIIRLLIILAIAKTIFIKYIDIIKAVIPTPKEFFLYFNIFIKKLIP